MMAREFFEQSVALDQRINSKIRQIEALNDLATKCTSAFTGMPRNPNHGQSTMADIIIKIVDLQAEINRDIDRLVDLKRDMMKVINCLDKPEHQTLLELRYLCSYSWERVAEEMKVSLHHVYKILKQALEDAEKWIPNETG